MSNLFDLSAIGSAYEKDCKNFDNSYISGFFIAYDFWPIFAMVAVITLTIGRIEAFALLVLKGGALNSLINWGVRELIAQEGPEPGCSAKYQMPAYASDALSFICVCLFCSSGFIYDVPINILNSTIIWMGVPAAIYCRIWLRFNTGPQLVAGNAFGIFEAIIYCLFLRYIMVYIRIENWFLKGKKIFTSCQDTLINPKKPFIYLSHSPEKLKLKLEGSPLTENDNTKKNITVEQRTGY